MRDHAHGVRATENALAQFDSRKVSVQSGTTSRLTFYRLIEQAREPQRPDRSAAGTLPMRAAQYCEAVSAASAFGWWLFPPMDFSLLWDGATVFWHYDGLPSWMPLEAVQFPHFSTRFDQAAPEHALGCAPPFLTVLTEPGIVQVWTGLIVRSPPDWSILIRAPANLPNPGGFVLYEGIVETDRWFGPLFTNLRLTRTHTPVHFRADFPFAQIQPLPRTVYEGEILGNFSHVSSIDSWIEQDWEDYTETVIRPNNDPNRRPGLYAVAARKRRRLGCPHQNSGKA
jgi:hypothetical protein